MIKLTNIEEVKTLQSNLRATFESEAGREVMDFLEDVVGYDQSIFDSSSEYMTFVNDGKRQVVATIKTLLKLTPEQVVALELNKEE